MIDILDMYFQCCFVCNPRQFRKGRYPPFYNKKKQQQKQKQKNNNKNNSNSKKKGLQASGN